MPGRRASIVHGSCKNPVRSPVACLYAAEVPELSAGLPGIPDLPWGSLSHRQVLAELATEGWVPRGVGDWAVALRSPEGTVVARVCPFDPAYWAFVDLYRECAGNRWLPGIELAADLEGGGSVVFLEYVAPLDHPVDGQFAEQWRTRAADPEFQKVSRAAQMIDAEYQKFNALVGQVRLGRRPHLPSRRWAARAARRLLHGWDGSVRRNPRRRRRGVPPDSARADALCAGNPVYRPREQHRRDPCPQKGLGTRSRPHRAALAENWGCRTRRTNLVMSNHPFP